MAAPECRFDGSPAVIEVALSAGCLVYPDDRTQHLCAQHADRMTALGSSHVLWDIDDKKEDEGYQDALDIGGDG